MYCEKLKPILEDLENKEIELAGGCVVGMVLAELNSLIKYICNLTLGKKKYENVKDEIIKIKEDADTLKNEVLQIIDEDKKIVEEILDGYKIRHEEPFKYQNVNKKAVEFCMEVTKKSLEILKLTNRISKIGNQMLSSDFKICGFYGLASVEASIVNVKTNLDSIEDEEYKLDVRLKCLKIYNEAQIIQKQILGDYMF